jgi:hypothetical protein
VLDHHVDHGEPLMRRAPPGVRPGVRRKARSVAACGTEIARLPRNSRTNEVAMGEVIHVTFGVEREWEQTHAKAVDGLVTIGSLYGDDEELMRAKAECLYQLLREIVEDVPSTQITTALPQDLSEAQLELVTAAVREAALKGIQVAMMHSVESLMNAIYDLCTSKLKEGSA